MIQLTCARTFAVAGILEQWLNSWEDGRDEKDIEEEERPTHYRPNHFMGPGSSVGLQRWNDCRHRPIRVTSEVEEARCTQIEACARETQNKHSSQIVSCSLAGRIILAYDPTACQASSNASS